MKMTSRIDDALAAMHDGNTALSERRAANYLGLSPKTLRYLRVKGCAPRFKFSDNQKKTPFYTKHNLNVWKYGNDNTGNILSFGWRDNIEYERDHSKDKNGKVMSSTVFMNQFVSHRVIARIMGIAQSTFNLLIRCGAAPPSTDGKYCISTVNAWAEGQDLGRVPNSRAAYSLPPKRLVVVSREQSARELLPSQQDEFWYGLVDETTAARFAGVSVNLLRAMRELKEGPPVETTSTLEFGYRRDDIRRWLTHLAKNCELGIPNRRQTYCSPMGE